MAKHRDIISDLHNTKRALLASERKQRRATKQFRNLEKILEPIVAKMELWASMPLADEANAFKVLTVGQCRELLRVLKPDPTVVDESDEVEEDT